MNNNFKIVHALYQCNDIQNGVSEKHWPSGPNDILIGYMIGSERVGSLEELCFKLEITEDNSNLYLEMPDNEIRKLCEIRKALYTKPVS